jgi:hypothetical protein
VRYRLKKKGGGGGLTAQVSVMAYIVYAWSEGNCQGQLTAPQQFNIYQAVKSLTRQQGKICFTKIEKPLRGFFPCGF